MALTGAGGDRLCARRSALHFVAAIGNLVCTKLLIDAGADLNLGDKDGVPLPIWVLASWLVKAYVAASGLIGHNRQEVTIAAQCL